MKEILFALALLGAVNLMNCVNYPQTPEGFADLDNYGTNFATRKSYYRLATMGVRVCQKLKILTK